MANAEKGNHWGRRMGDHRSIGDGAGRAGAASAETPAACAHERYWAGSLPESVNLHLAQAKSGCSPAFVPRPSIENTASATGRAKAQPAGQHAAGFAERWDRHSFPATDVAASASIA